MSIVTTLARSPRSARSSAPGLERSSSASARSGGLRLLRAGLQALVMLGLLHGAVALAQGGTTTRVSVDSAGAQGNWFSLRSSISADGRYVAFASASDNLVPGDTNGQVDVFVHDQHLGLTSRVSVDSGGGQASKACDYPSISADGRFVAFHSLADNLVAGDTNGCSDVFLRDRQTGSTTRVSVDSSGGQGSGSSSIASISADGRHVAFVSMASNLVQGDTNGTWDIFVHDRTTGPTIRASVDSAGNQANDFSSDASISADGRYVAFASLATNLVAGDTNGREDIFVRDLQMGVTSRVSVSSTGGEGNHNSYVPSISADGRHVAFDSWASNLVSGDTNTTGDIFVHDRASGRTTRVSVDSSGIQGNGYCQDPSISADGRFVAFESEADNLVPGDIWGLMDVFVHDRLQGLTQRVSVSSTGQGGKKDSTWASISGDGRYVSFQSRANNLVPGDTNESLDIFVRDRWHCDDRVEIYCTAKVSSSGCVPAMGFSGVPSATAPSGFTVKASQVEPGKPGILFYSVTGPRALPFQGGFLCMETPIQRLPPQSSGSGGLPPCTGVLSLDLNAAGICASIGQGNLGWIQGWFRDPPSPGGTGLTDAIEFTVCQ